MGNISGQAKNDQIHLFLENITPDRIYFIKRPGRLLDFWTYNLGQNRWKICTPSPPKQGWENGAVWLLRGFNLDHDLGSMGVCWHFILSKILGVRLFQAGRLFNFSPVSASS